MVAGARRGARRGRETALHDCMPPPLSVGMLKKIWPVLSVALLAGCSTPFTITNLTPLQQARNTNNLYTVEAAAASRQQTLRWQSIRPQIVVGMESYPMRPILLMTNRWEGLVPVPASSGTLRYHYKFDYECNAFGSPRPDSAVSPEFTLKILESAPQQ